MRVAAVLFALLLARGLPRQAESNFKTDVQPILEHRCTPCHFAGGKMYGKLPFDRPETIARLGEKLFTRIKNEDERAAIRRFLAAQKAPR